MQILRWMVCFIAALDSHSLKMPGFVSAVKGHGGGDQDRQGTRAFGCKALNVNREQVLVEIEAPLSDLRKDCCETCKFEVARYMRTSKHLLAAVAEQVGTAYADEFFPSWAALGRMATPRVRSLAPQRACCSP